MPAQPFYTEEFTPAGGAVTDASIERGKGDAMLANEDAKARLFQQHLQTGLKGMQDVLSQLPPEVQAQVGDPTPMAATDATRVQWYQGLNQTINRFNMAQSASSGDQAGVDKLSLNDPKAAQGQFDKVASNQAFADFGKGFSPTKTESKVTMGMDNLRNAIVSQESGDNYGAQGPDYTKADGSAASMNTGDIALGRYQILPKTWFSKIGLDHTKAEDRKKFLETPALQDEAFNIVIQDGMTKYNGNIDKVLADYYGGPRAAALVGTPAADKPQSGGMPSINEYVQSVKGKMQAGGAPAEGPSVETTEKPKNAEDVILEMLKEKPELIGDPKVEALLKHLGKGESDIKAMMLAQRVAEEQGRNARSGANLSMRREALDDKNQQKLYDDLVKMEAPVITQVFEDVDTMLQGMGGLSGLDTVLPGTDLWDRNVVPLLKGETSVKMSSLLQRLYSLELKRISGVAVSDAEFKRYQKVFNSGGTNNPEEQMFALKAYVRAYKRQLSLAKSAYGEKTWSKVAVAAGIDPDWMVPVGNAVKGEEGTKESRTPGATTAKVADKDEKPGDKAAAAKTKYKLEY